MNAANLKAAAYEAVVSGDLETAAHCAREWLSLGLPPLELIDDSLTKGITKVGELWEEGDYFLPELTAGAEAMKAAMQVLSPGLIEGEAGRIRQSVVIGTVYGDIHDIGKSLVATMLRANGFDVHDLGADVPPAQFLAAQKRTDARLICISALLTTTMIGIKDVIEAFKTAGLRERVRFLVGGAPITREWTMEVGADEYGDTAVAAVRIARRLFESL